MTKVKKLLIFCPLIFLVLLIPINMLIHKVIVPHTPLIENQGVLISLLIILSGLCCGFIGVLGQNKMAWYIKLLIILLYMPVIIFSLLISGM